MMEVNVIVVIATSLGRTDFLIDRSLKSVYEQEELMPGQVIIVDDNAAASEFQKIQQAVHDLRNKMIAERFGISQKEIPASIFPTTVIKNKRTQGNSGTGAWNTGAERALAFSAEHENTYMAILDDDDRWLPGYLRACSDLIQSHHADHPGVVPMAVVAGLRRIESTQSIEILLPPELLAQESFFIGNPGWQGSNTFVEINSFWESGAFDERMPSTNDRDLAIRLLEYREVSKRPILALPEPLVEHYAHGGMRVTTDPERKRKGLDIFYEKHLPKMSPEEKELSLARARRLFNYQIGP